MTYRTDNFGGEAQTQADVLNGPYPEHLSRYYKVVEMPYELAP